MTAEHPNKVAEQLAAQLQSDPVAAAQIKEFINPEGLLELLGLGNTYDEGYQTGYEAGCRDSE